MQLDYRRVDEATPAQWTVVAVFPTVAEWHFAKAVLERNRLSARMGHGADGSTRLLVPLTEIFWAADLLTKLDIPGDRIMPLPGTAAVNPRTTPPPLPGSRMADIGHDYLHPPDAAVLPATDLASVTPASQPGLGCLIAALWILLIGIIAVMILGYFLAFYSS